MKMLSSWLGACGLVAVLALSAFLGYKTFIWPPSAQAEIPRHPRLIAHAGGAVSGIRLSNSLEALDKAYRLGFRYFELDFSWTGGGELVAIHDWDNTWQNLFAPAMHRPETASDFAGLAMKGGLTPLTLPRLADWMSRHVDAFIITDVKVRNLDGLQHIRDALGSLSAKVIPQIYEPEEYEPVLTLGFEQIIYTLYRSRKNTYQVVQFAAATKLFAITLPKERIRRFNLARRLGRLGLPVYAHNVNEREEAAALGRLGATGFYTDALSPADVP